MLDSLVFKVKSISLSKYKGRKPSTLYVALMHNRRRIKAEMEYGFRINPNLSSKNIVLAGLDTVDEVMSLAEKIMISSDWSQKKRRFDHCQAIELMFSIPGRMEVDEVEFFKICLKWAKSQFAGHVLLSADVHYDESNPHCHVLFAPFKNGCYVGSAVISSAATKKLTASFSREVAVPLGFHHLDARFYGQSKKLMAEAVIQKLLNIKDPVLQSTVWPILVSNIKKSPLEYVKALGVDVREIRSVPGSASNELGL